VPQNYWLATMESGEADSCLVAAAPCLLAAMERLERGIRLWMSSPVEDSDLEAARAAIGQARRAGAHTPGPWFYDEGAKLIRARASGALVASMNSWDGAVNHEANAHVIAAAPCILAALERLVEGVRLWISKPVEDSDMEAARAAIGQARRAGEFLLASGRAGHE
jgi:hypothetical protein